MIGDLLKDFLRSLLLMVLAIYGKATLLLSAFSKFHFFSARYSSRSFCHRAMNEVSNVRPNREWCAMTFISDRGYDVRPRGEIAVKKTHRLNIAKNFDAS